VRACVRGVLVFFYWSCLRAVLVLFFIQTDIILYGLAVRTVIITCFSSGD
jgi:hypothetical protein